MNETGNKRTAHGSIGMNEKTGTVETQEPEKASITLPGTVEKVIPAPHPSMPEKAQIAVEGADDLYKEIRIENKLTDENGDKVQLKVGTEVEVTIEASVEEKAPETPAKGS
jgi:hypothetical protein